jgi:methionyl-tRNA formyltransferase
LGGINIHGSLLPKYRGAAPVNWAIYHGEEETGVSIIHMTPKLDAGPIIAQARTPIRPEETAEQLEARLAVIAAQLVPAAVEALESGRTEPIDQDAWQASRAPRLKKTDGLIDWSRPASAIKSQIRAVQPWPKAHTFWHRPGAGPLRLIVGPVTVLSTPAPSARGGTVLQAEGDQLVVATGQDALLLSSLQPAGKRMLPVAEFLRGYRVQRGERFGPHE